MHKRSPVGKSLAQQLITCQVSWHLLWLVLLMAFKSTVTVTGTIVSALLKYKCWPNMAVYKWKQNSKFLRNQIASAIFRILRVLECYPVPHRFNYRYHKFIFTKTDINWYFKMLPCQTFHWSLTVILSGTVWPQYCMSLRVDIILSHI